MNSSRKIKLYRLHSFNNNINCRTNTKFAIPGIRNPVTSTSTNDTNSEFFFAS